MDFWTFSVVILICCKQKAYAKYVYMDIWMDILKYAWKLSTQRGAPNRADRLWFLSKIWLMDRWTQLFSPLLSTSKLTRTWKCRQWNSRCLHEFQVCGTSFIKGIFHSTGRLPAIINSIVSHVLWKRKNHSVVTFHSISMSMKININFFLFFKFEKKSIIISFGLFYRENWKKHWWVSSEVACNSLTQRYNRGDK